MDIKVAVVLLADVTGAGDMGRMANALTVAREFQQASDPVKLIFDGAGTKWIGQLSKPDHKYHALFQSVRSVVSGVCRYCATAYGVSDEVQAGGFELTDEYEGHPSLRSLIGAGYQVITF